MYDDALSPVAPLCPGCLSGSAEPAFASPAKAALLDVASSWISHYPPAFKGSGGGRVAGLGMNEYELAQNPQLTEYAVKDLNQDPKLPYEDDAFDAVTIAVSIDYMAQPLQLLQEIHRVLREGGTAYMSFSNRCFPTKVVKMWLDTNDSGRIWIVGSYVHFAGGFSSPAVLDISTHPGRTDPMYVVSATKLPAAGNPDSGEL
jgi:SAM-dependent methyltransferase